MSTLDVVAYAGENHGGVKPANFLDIGGGASAEVMAAGLDVILGDPQVKSVFVNVFGGITACDAVAKGIVGALAELGRRREQAARRAPRRQQRRRGPRILRRGQPPAGHPGRHHGRGRRQGRRARQRSEVRDSEHVDLPQQGLQGHRPGHHRRRGHQAHRPHAEGRHPGRRRRQRPQGRHHGHHDGDASSCPSSARSPRPSRRPAPTSRSPSCRRPSPRTPSIEAIDAEIPLLVVITEGVPVQDSAEFWA